MRAKGRVAIPNANVPISKNCAPRELFAAKSGPSQRTRPPFAPSIKRTVSGRKTANVYPIAQRYRNEDRLGSWTPDRLNAGNITAEIEREMIKSLDTTSNGVA